MRHSIKKRDNVAKSRPGSKTDDEIKKNLIHGIVILIHLNWCSNIVFIIACIVLE